MCWRVRSGNLLQVLMLECTSCGAQVSHDPLYQFTCAISSPPFPNYIWENMEELFVGASQLLQLGLICHQAHAHKH